MWAVGTRPLSANGEKLLDHPGQAALCPLRAFCLWGAALLCQGAGAVGKIALHSPHKQIKLELCPPPRGRKVRSSLLAQRRVKCGLQESVSPDHQDSTPSSCSIFSVQWEETPQGTLYFRSLQPPPPRHTHPRPHATRHTPSPMLVGSIIAPTGELSSRWLRSADVKLLRDCSIGLQRLS